MTVDLIAETLNAHSISADHFRRLGGWRWWCSCQTDGEHIHLDWADAYAAGARHQAERVADALTAGKVAAA